MKNPSIVLASGSPRRYDLLSSLGLTFEVIIPEIDEIQLPNERPEDCVRRLSREKAQCVAYQLNRSPVIILAADTVAVFRDENTPSKEKFLSKPLDPVHAKEILLTLRERPHKVITGVSLLRTGDNPVQLTKAITTIVYMRNYSEKEIDDYISSGSPFDKAGGYAIQDSEFHPVDHIEGSYSNVVGLPLETVTKMLTSLNIHVKSN